MSFQTVINSLFNIGYVFSPAYGFIPQLYSGNVTYNPILSLLTIFSSVLKLFPSEQKVTGTLQNQFFFCILVHIYLIHKQVPNIKNVSLPVFNAMPYSRAIFRYFSATIGSFILLVAFLNMYGFSSLFLKLSILIEVTISILHVKFQEKKANFVFFLCILTLGDMLKIFLFLVQFSAPIEIVITTTFQLAVNFYLLFNHFFEK